MYETILFSTRNPDGGQYVVPSPLQTAMVCSIKDALAACSEYISSWNLGGGNWCGDAGRVYQSGELVSTISYNGRVVVAEWPT